MANISAMYVWLNFYVCVCDFFFYWSVFTVCVSFGCTCMTFFRSTAKLKGKVTEISHIPLLLPHTEPPLLSTLFFCILIFFLFSAFLFSLCLVSVLHLLFFHLCILWLMFLFSPASSFPLWFLIFLYVCESALLKSTSWVHKHHSILWVWDPEL